MFLQKKMIKSRQTQQSFFIFIYVICLFVFDCAGSSLLHRLFSRCGDGGYSLPAGHSLSFNIGFSCGAQLWSTG